MLRRNRALVLPLHHFRKSVRLSTIRAFHVTYCVFLRRIPSAGKQFPEIRSFAHEQTVAGEFQSQPNKATYNNFYGIESDEGVIHIEEQAKAPVSLHDAFINKFGSKINPEKFKNTRFGTIRLDKENKPILHGQYESSSRTLDEDFEMDRIPKTSKRQSIFVKDIYKNISQLINQTEMSNLMTKPSGENIISESLISCKEENFENPDNLKNELCFEQQPKKDGTVTSKTDVSFIDKSYFPDQIIENTNSEIIAPETFSESSKESLSYIDECYFSNEPINSNNDKDVKYATDNGDFLDEKMKHEVDFIHGNTSSIARETFSIKDNCDKFGNEIDKRKESFSFIDESFFGDEIGNKNRDKNAHVSSEKVNLLKRSTNIYNEHEANESHKTNSDRDQMCFSPKNESNSKRHLESNLYNNLSDQKISLNLQGHNSASSKSFIDQFQKPIQGELLTSNLDKKNIFLFHRGGDRPPFNPKIAPENISNFTKEGSQEIKKSHETKSKIALVPESLNSSEEKRTNDDKPETAYDFVKKFRSGKTLTYHELSSGMLKKYEEKLDSKGFRILKHQVPNLMYFTRDEILNLLVQNVLYSDDDIVVLNKPYNLVIHESQSIKDACLSKHLDDLAAELDKQNKNPKLLTVHRLDKETTGCLLLARNEVSAQRLKSLFAQRKIAKTYWIVTTKVPDPSEGIIDIPIAEGSVDKKSRMVLHPNLPKDVAYRNHSKNGKRAVTHYKVIAESGSAALIEVKPETGIKHQIRVHFGFGLSSPILGDHKYSYLDKMVPQKLPTDLLQKLHVRQSKVRHIPMHIYARSIFIPQYSEGRNLFVMAPLPIHMSKNLQKLKFRKN